MSSPPNHFLYYIMQKSQAIINNHLNKILKILAEAALQKQKPQIITITGSVGKTSIKEGVYLALKNNLKVQRSVKNYNNEIGVPLTIAGWQGINPGHSIIKWLKIIMKLFVLGLIKSKKYPEFLILEIAADKPGDLQYLMSIISKGIFKASVLTAVSPSHLEFFGSMENIFQEKITPFHYLPDNSIAVVNADSNDLEKIKKAIKTQIITYGIENTADVMANDIETNKDGLKFQITTKKESAYFLLKGGIFTHQIYPILAGVVLADFFGVELNAALAGLKEYEIAPGRGKIIEGINGSLIIDDTYNSSPEAVKKALQSLAKLPFGARKIAVLGDMLELGNESPDLHFTAGKMVFEQGFDFLFAFGTFSRHILEGFQKNGEKENARHFANIEELIAYLKNFLQNNDIVLVKASQGMRAELIVKAIMQKPEKAKYLLARQTKDWE